MTVLSPRREKTSKERGDYFSFIPNYVMGGVSYTFSVWHQIKWQENLWLDQAGGRSPEFLS